VDYLVIPGGIDVEAEKATWTKWYNDEYRPALRRNPKLRMAYITFVDWLLAAGARRTTDEELTVVEL